MAGKVAGKNDVRNANIEVFWQNDVSYRDRGMFIKFSLLAFRKWQIIFISRSQHDNHSNFCDAAHYSCRYGREADPLEYKTDVSPLAMFSKL
jgi:hypothetical protein